MSSLRPVSYVSPNIIDLDSRYLLDEASEPSSESVVQNSRLLLDEASEVNYSDVPEETLVEIVKYSFKSGSAERITGIVFAGHDLNAIMSLFKMATAPLLDEIHHFLSQDEALSILSQITISDEDALVKVVALREKITALGIEPPENMFNTDTYHEMRKPMQEELDRSLTLTWRGNGKEGFEGTGLRNQIAFTKVPALPGLDASADEIRDFFKNEVNSTYFNKVTIISIYNEDLKILPAEVITQFPWLQDLKVFSKKIDLLPPAIDGLHMLRYFQIPKVDFRSLSQNFQKRLYFFNGSYTVNHPQWGNLARLSQG